MRAEHSSCSIEKSTQMITNTLASVATPHEWTVVGGDKDYDNFDYLPSFSINRAGIILCKYTNYEHLSFKKIF